VRLQFASKQNVDHANTHPICWQVPLDSLLPLSFTDPLSGAFFILLLLSSFLGLSAVQIPNVNDKALHAVTFFLLTLVFYWIIDGSRRRVLNLTLTTCTVVLGVGSEFLQAILPNGRVFDLYDIVANIVGSLAALALCSWYHKRMLERKRGRKYHLVSGEDGDVELGESSGGDRGDDGQETGVVDRERTLEDEVDNWDENAEDNWEDEEGQGGGDNTSAEGQKTPSRSSGDGEGVVSEGKK
jgi:VanZ family protein